MEENGLTQLESDTDRVEWRHPDGRVFTDDEYYATGYSDGTWGMDLDWHSLRRYPPLYLHGYKDALGDKELALDDLT